MTKTHILLIAVLSVALTGCSQMREQLGLNRNSPDEFTVVKRAPLSLPPEYNLRPPGAEGNTSLTQVNSDRETVKRAVFGANGNVEDDTPKDAETALLKNIGAKQANPDIRKILDQESGYVVFEERTTIDRILRRDPNGNVKESLVDPKAEAERIKTNAEEGRPVNEGDVPVIEKRETALDKLF